jgi:hypothetical protein
MPQYWLNPGSTRGENPLLPISKERILLKTKLETSITEIISTQEGLPAVRRLERPQNELWIWHWGHSEIGRAIMAGPYRKAEGSRRRPDSVNPTNRYTKASQRPQMSSKLS